MTMESLPIFLRDRASRIAVALGAAASAAAAVWLLPPAFAIPLVVVAIAAAASATASLKSMAQLQRTARLESVVREASSPGTKSIFDTETGFCSEWYFMLRLEEELARAKRTGQKFVLLIVEPRRRLGKRVQQRLLRCLEGAFRSIDLVGRLAEWRFAVVLVGCEREGAQAVIRRINTIVGRGNIRIGLAVHPQDGQDWRSLLAAAGGTPEDLYPSADPIWTSGAASAFDSEPKQRDAA